MAHRVAVLWRKAIRTLGMVGTVARWPHRLGREKRMVAKYRRIGDKLQQFSRPMKMSNGAMAPRSVPTHGGAGRINRVRIDPHDAQHWYACAPAGGLWHSWDEGQTWDVFGVDVLAPLGGDRPLD